jgi:hypothetical protein
MAGGGPGEGQLHSIEGARVPLLIIVAVWSRVALARAPAPLANRAWYWPLLAGLFGARLCGGCCVRAIRHGDRAPGS